MKRRNTPTKSTILSILKQEGSALSQDSIIEKADGSIDRVTVYRVLNRFCDDGLVHKILADDGKYYFALCLNCTDKEHKHDHFHFRCLKCEKVECLPQEITVKLPDGYTMHDCNSWVNGYCAACA